NQVASQRAGAGAWGIMGASERGRYHARGAWRIATERDPCQDATAEFLRRTAVWHRHGPCGVLAHVSCKEPRADPERTHEPDAALDATGRSRLQGSLQPSGTDDLGAKPDRKPRLWRLRGTRG